MKIKVETHNEECHVAIQDGILMFKHGLYSKYLPKAVIYAENQDLQVKFKEELQHIPYAVALQKSECNKNNDYEFLSHYQSILRGELSHWTLHDIELRPDVLALQYYKYDHDYEDQTILLYDAATVTLTDGAGSQVTFSQKQDPNVLLAELTTEERITKHLTVRATDKGRIIERSYRWTTEEGDDAAFRRLAQSSPIGGRYEWRAWEL